jgi:hypothetical protein
LLLNFSGRTAVVESTRSATWLEEAGLTAGPFTLEGYFDVPADDVYQFQLNTRIKTTLTIDSKVIPDHGGSPWQYAPVHLAAGRHRVEIAGTATAESRLDIRFGGSGTSSLDSSRFFYDPGTAK